MNKKQIISEYMSEIGKESHQKSPRDKEHFREIQKKSVEKRKANQRALKLSTTPAKK